MPVLVVEDDAVQRYAIAETLRQHNYEVLTATGGREAIEILASGRCRLVITDWMMPELNGIGLCRAIREGHFGDSIYVIVVTSLDDPRDVRLAISSGADAFIPKPWSRQQLLARVRSGERALDSASRETTVELAV